MEYLISEYTLKNLTDAAQRQGVNNLSADEILAIGNAKDLLSDPVAAIHIATREVIEEFSYVPPEDTEELSRVLEYIAKRMLWQEVEWRDSVVEACEEYGLEKV